jgi:hypothetical protein
VSEEHIAECTAMIREAVLRLQSDCYEDERGAARYLGIGVRTFGKYRHSIPHFRLGGTGKRLYRRAELDDWLEARHRVHSMDEEKGIQALVDEVCGQVLGVRKG